MMGMREWFKSPEEPDDDLGELREAVEQMRSVAKDLRHTQERMADNVDRLESK